MAEGLMDFSDVIGKGTLRDETFRCLLLVCATANCNAEGAREKNWSGKWQELSYSPVNGGLLKSHAARHECFFAIVCW